MKKATFLLLVFMISSVGVFAPAAAAQSHMVHAGIGAGIGVPFIADAEVFLSYEYAILPVLSVGASVGFQIYPLALYGMAIASAVDDTDINSIFNFLAEAQLHWYPWAKSFHIDFSFGYANYLDSMHTLLIAPGVGWRIDFGEPGGVFMNIGLRAEVFMPLGDSFLKTDEGVDFVPVNFLSFRLSLGYRF